MKKISYAESERMCEATFRGCGAWWHLYTAGKMSSILFVDDDDYRYAMNLLARCHKETGSITIVAFEIMSNHIHIVLCGSEHNARHLSIFFGGDSAGISQKEQRRGYEIIPDEPEICL